MSTYARSKEARDLELHRAALAGDAEAKRTLEARDLLAKADKATIELRDKAAAGDANAMARLRQIANGHTPAAPAAAASSGVTKIDVGLAGSAATKRERDRVATVFASEASKGRERLCASLLTAPEGWTAAQITAHLPNLSTDAQLEAKKRSKANERADAVWDKANASVEGRKADASDTKASASSDVWDRAYSQVNGGTAR